MNTQSMPTRNDRIAIAAVRGNEYLWKAREAEAKGNLQKADEFYRKGMVWFIRRDKLRVTPI